MTYYLSYYTPYVRVNLAEWTGLEPATPGVTGQCANQLRYHSKSLMSFYYSVESVTCQPIMAILAPWTGIEPA